MPKLKAEPSTPLPYMPPEKVLVLCRICQDPNVLVLYKVFRAGAMVDLEDAPQTPMGATHRCQEEG